MIKKILKLNNKNGGYTLLFAVLVSSVVLSIGISILTISKKEFLLSSSARESTSAFYAADTGMECAIYADNSLKFSTTTPPGPGIFTCAKSLDIAPNLSYGDEPVDNTATFSFDLNINDISCAVVTVNKYYDDDPDLGLILRTTITSRGYNLGWESGVCNGPSPRRVERALRLTY